VHIAQIDVRGVHDQRASGGLFRGDALEHSAIHRRSHFALKAGQSEKGRVVWQEEEQAARDRPVRLRIAVHPDDAFNGFVVAEKGEWSDHFAGADAGDHIELRTCQFAGDASPPLEDPGAERAPIPAAGND
jgi:hypothetical protein